MWTWVKERVKPQVTRAPKTLTDKEEIVFLMKYITTNDIAHHLVKMGWERGTPYHSSRALLVKWPMMLWFFKDHPEIAISTGEPGLWHGKNITVLSQETFIEGEWVEMVKSVLKTVIKTRNKRQRAYRKNQAQEDAKDKAYIAALKMDA